MFEIDKQAFGAFVCALRKERGLTQKELAQRLFISDKAVSKWETGVSIPDTALLIPLSQVLKVTVTELLECRRSEKTTLDADEAEALVQKAIRFSGEESPRPDRRKNGLILLGSAAAAALELAAVYLLGSPPEDAVSLFLMPLLALIFGAYFWLFIRERLPNYYDENPISAYSDGFFRMNLPGVSFNNSNWPYIIRAGRAWTLAVLLGGPLAYGALYLLFPPHLARNGEFVLLAVVLGGLFIPLYLAAKRHA